MDWCLQRRDSWITSLLVCIGRLFIRTNRAENVLRECSRLVHLDWSFPGPSARHQQVTRRETSLTKAKFGDRRIWSVCQLWRRGGSLQRSFVPVETVFRPKRRHPKCAQGSCGAWFMATVLLLHKLIAIASLRGESSQLRHIASSHRGRGLECTCTGRQRQRIIPSIKPTWSVPLQDDSRARTGPATSLSFSLSQFPLLYSTMYP